MHVAKPRDLLYIAKADASYTKTAMTVSLNECDWPHVFCFFSLTAGLILPASEHSGPDSTKHLSIVTVVLTSVVKSS